ncbi:MAG: hypothetical protein M0Q15_16400 [Nevskia sp.]|jgi:hypothetical protein|nr:hypothetical protein [Nevskia sp.]
MDVELLSPQELPEWFVYPEDFLNALQSEVHNIGAAWQFLHGKWLRVRYSGLKKRFPSRDLVPFARRLDCDDIACWERSSFPSVHVVHDFCAPGWEERQSFPSFLAWVSDAQKEARDFDD